MHPPPRDHDSPPAMDFNVPTVVFRSSRGYGKTKMQEDLERRWAESGGTFPVPDLTPIYEQLRRAVADAAATMTKTMSSLREAGLIPEEPPTDPRARALWARKNRSTGPARPSAAQARRPRRHK